MEEKIFLDEHGITITNTKVTFPENKVFMLDDINHVKLEPGWARLLPTLCILIGGLNLAFDLFTMRLELFSLVGSFFWLAIGLVWWFLQKPAYYLILKTKAHGKIKTYNSKDQKLLKRICSSISDLVGAK
jgi:hypothetical protein